MHCNIFRRMNQRIASIFLSATWIFSAATPILENGLIFAPGWGDYTLTWLWCSKKSGLSNTEEVERRTTWLSPTQGLPDAFREFVSLQHIWRASDCRKLSSLSEAFEGNRPDLSSLSSFRMLGNWAALRGTRLTPSVVRRVILALF